MRVYSKSIIPFVIGIFLNRPHRFHVRIKALCYFISILFIGNGCVPCYYSPNTQNVPLFEEQFDANVLVAYRCGATAIGCDIQAALAVTDHIGIMANYNHFGLHWDYSDDFWGFGRGYHKGDLFEIGAGYFRPLKKKMMFETYGGFGWGDVKNDYEGYLEHNLYHRYFIQPALGWHINQKINLSASAMKNCFTIH